MICMPVNPQLSDSSITRSVDGITSSVFSQIKKRTSDFEIIEMRLSAATWWLSALGMWQSKDSGGKFLR